MTEQQEIPVWCAGNKWCPITATAKLIGKKWHPVIIHRLLEVEPVGFNALKEEVDGISSKVLSESLDDLQEKGLVNRDIVSEKPVRVKYTLTDRGKDLKPVIVEMMNWANRNLSDPDEK
jgi:DNA-binding HxlR family transcriptional regulator